MFVWNDRVSISLELRASVLITFLPRSVVFDTGSMRFVSSTYDTRLAEEEGAIALLLLSSRVMHRQGPSVVSHLCLLCFIKSPAQQGSVSDNMVLAEASISS